MRCAKTPLTLAVLALSVVACSVLPSTKHEASATKATDSIATQQSLSVEKIVDLAPPSVSLIPTQVVGTNNDGSVTTIPSGYRASVKVNSSSGQTAVSNTKAEGEFLNTIPMGVKLLLLGLGLLLVAFAVGVVIRYLRNTAFGQAAALADDVLKRKIQQIRDHAITSTDPNEIAKLSREIAGLEAERGKLASK